MIAGIDVEIPGAIPSSLSSGDAVTWTSNRAVNNEGWQICFSNSTSLPTNQSDCQCIGGTDACGGHQPGHAYCYLNGGVTAGSCPGAEWGSSRGLYYSEKPCINHVCQCIGGTGYGNTCGGGDPYNWGNWCYLKGGNDAASCPGATWSLYTGKYQSAEPCRGYNMLDSDSSSIFRSSVFTTTMAILGFMVASTLIYKLVKISQSGKNVKKSNVEKEECDAADVLAFSAPPEYAVAYDLQAVNQEQYEGIYVEDEKSNYVGPSAPPPPGYDEIVQGI